MTRTLLFRRAAQRDLEEAIDWYENQRAGLGREFYAEVCSCLVQVAESPQRFRKIRGPVRRAVLSRFPYTIHFLLEQTHVVVLAVFHASRDPRQLERRD